MLGGRPARRFLSHGEQAQHIINGAGWMQLLSDLAGTDNPITHELLYSHQVTAPPRGAESGGDDVTTGTIETVTSASLRG